MNGSGEKVLNSRSFTKIFLSFVRGTAPELGVRSDDRTSSLGRAVPSAAKGRISVNPRKFNAILKGLPHECKVLILSP